VQVLGQAFDFKRGDPERVKVSQKFEVKEPFQNLEVISQAPVDNAWIDLDMDLVNYKTGESRSFSHGIEFYHGADSDGAWSEGGTSGNTTLGNLPAGTYYLAIEPTADEKISTMTYNVWAKRGVVVWSNFWIVFVLIIGVPCFVGWRSRSFEVQRWSQSDFSPYESGGDGGND